MNSFKSLIIPDRKKMILFGIFVLITLAGMIQRSPITESPPSPNPSPLGDFSFTLLSFLLAFPYQLLVIWLSLIGVFPMYRFSWLVIAGNLVYLYFLSCLSISGFNRYSHRFSKWHWAAMIGIPFILLVLYLILLNFPPLFVDNLWNYLGVFIIVVLYLHLLFCLGFFVYEEMA